MSKIKHSGSAESMTVTGSSCGIKPSIEAVATGYEIDFSKAKALLESNSETKPSSEKST